MQRMFRLLFMVLGWGVVLWANSADAEEKPVEPAAGGIAVVQVPGPVPPAVRRGPDRTIDIAGIDRVTRAVFASDGRTLWLLGEDDPPGTPRDPATTWPRVLGLDLASGVVSQDLRLPRRAGVLTLSDLVVAEHTVWVSGSYREPTAVPLTDPELVIPDQPRYFIFPQTRRELDAQEFVASAAIGQPLAVQCWFADEPPYRLQTHSMEVDRDRLKRQRFRIGREVEPGRTRYRFNDPATGRTRLEVLAGRNLNATLSRNGRYLTVRRSERRGDLNDTIWRYDVANSAWGWPRAVRGQKRSLYAISPDGSATAIVGADGVGNRIDLYLFDDAERYDAELAARMAEALNPPKLASPTPKPRRTVTLPSPDAELGPGPDASFPLEGLGRPWTIQVEADGSRAYIVHRVEGEGNPAPQEDRVRCVDLANGQSVWEVPCPFPWTYRVNSREGIGLVMDPNYLIFVNTHAVQRGAATPDSVAPFHLRSEVRLLHKATGGTRGTTYATAVHDSVSFSPVVLPPEHPDMGSPNWPRSDRLVLIQHARPPAVIDGQNDPAAWHWRIERWELPGGRRRVLMRSPTPEAYDGPTLGFRPRIDTLSLGKDGKSVAALWSLMFQGQPAEHRYPTNTAAVLRFDAETGRRLGVLPLPELKSGRFVRRHVPGGLWQVYDPEGEALDFWRLDSDAAGLELQVQPNGWEMWERVNSRALWWEYQQTNGRVDRRALLRLDPETGRTDGPRKTRPPSNADMASWGVDLWAYAHDGSAAVALSYPKNDLSFRPPVTLHRYDFTPVGAVAGGAEVISVPFRNALAGDAASDPVMHPGDLIRYTRSYAHLGREPMTGEDPLAGKVRTLRPSDLEPITLDSTIGLGDFLAVRLTPTDAGDAPEELNSAVDENGSITVPEAGGVSVAGLSRDLAAKRIGELLKAAGREVAVEVEVVQSRRNVVTLIPNHQDGNLRLGAYTLPDGDFRFSEFVALVGGTLPDDTTAVYILRKRKPTATH